MNDTLIEKESQEIAVAVRPDQKSISDIITHDNQILTFDIYRGKRGNKGIWGRKIFFQALVNLSMIERTLEGYKPTAVAIAKYPHFFVNVDNTWGFNPDAEDEIEDTLHRALFKVQDRLYKLELEERAVKAKEKREADKRKQILNQKEEGLF